MVNLKNFLKVRYLFLINLIIEYLIAELSLDIIQFKNGKCVMITFHEISEKRAWNELMILHTRQLSSYLTQFSRKLERLNGKILQDDSTTEVLGTTYVAINQIY